MLTNTLTWGLAPVGCRHEKLITKTCLNNVDPLKPLLYSKPGVLQGYIVFFLFLLKNIDCGYSLEPLRRGGSNEYTQSVFLSRNMKKKSEFLSENFQFLVVKFSIYLNKPVFLMSTKVQNVCDRFPAMNAVRSHLLEVCQISLSDFFSWQVSVQKLLCSFPFYEV